MNADLFGPSGGFNSIGGNSQPRSSMPVGTPPQRFQQPQSGLGTMPGAGGMSPSAPYMPNDPKPAFNTPAPPQIGPRNTGPLDPKIAAGGYQQLKNQIPGNFAFGHSQGNMFNNAGYGMPQIGQPSGLSPELLMQLLQMFGSSNPAQSIFGR